MIYYQLWDEKDYEYSFLNKLKAIVKDNKKNIYFGFDYGFYNGIEIFYGSNKDKELSYRVYDELKKRKINIKIISNIPYDFDLIVLFGYTNNKKQKKYLIKKEKKVLKAIEKALCI